MEYTNTNQQQGAQSQQQNASIKKSIFSVMKNIPSLNNDQQQNDGTQDIPIKLIAVDQHHKVFNTQPKKEEEKIVFKEIPVRLENTEKQETTDESVTPHFLKVVNNRLARRRIPIAVGVVVVTLIAAFVLGGGNSLKSQLTVVPDNSSVSIPSDVQNNDIPSSLNMNISAVNDLLVKNDDILNKNVNEYEEVQDVSSNVTAGDVIKKSDVSGVDLHTSSDINEVYDPLVIGSQVSDVTLNNAADKTAESGPETMVIVLVSMFIAGGFYMLILFRNQKNINTAKLILNNDGHNF